MLQVKFILYYIYYTQTTLRHTQPGLKNTKNVNEITVLNLMKSTFLLTIKLCVEIDQIFMLRSL